MCTVTVTGSVDEMPIVTEARGRATKTKCDVHSRELARKAPSVEHESSLPSNRVPSWIRSIGYEHFRLNFGPTLWLFAPVATFFVLASGFLEFYVLTSTGSLGVFLVGSYIVASTYFVCDYYMLRHSSSYRAIPEDKKFYVLSNVIKSGVLLSYCPLAAFTLYMCIVRGSWSNQRIRALGVLYAIPDFVSMLLVSRMATSTKLHHICVVVFAAINLLSDYTSDSVMRALVIYAIFSTFAYLVNLLLASRFISLSTQLAFVMSVAALTIYSACLAINWSWQLYYLKHLWHAQPALKERLKVFSYVTVMNIVVYDDVILVRWLRKNARRASIIERKCAVEKCA